MNGAPSTGPSLSDGLKLISLQPRHLEPAAAMLAQAFMNDPLMVYYLPDPDQRRRVLPGIMLASLRYCLRYGEVWTTPELDGAACWLPPAHGQFSLLGLVRAALGAVPLSLGWRTIGRMLRSEGRLDALHEANLPEPHWYLMLLGVSPARAGQGVGSQLIAAKVAQIQAAGVPVYLETMLGSNVDFYRKRGFRVLDEIELAPDGPHVWAMAAGLCGVEWQQTRS